IWASVDSTKAVAPPQKAITPIQKRAPGPPQPIAVATPAILPTPTRLPIVSASAWKGGESARFRIAVSLELAQHLREQTDLEHLGADREVEPHDDGEADDRHPHRIGDTLQWAVRSMSTAPCSWSRSLSCVVTVVCCDSRALPRGPECSSLFMHATRNRAECDHKYWNFSDTSACRPTGRTGVGGGNVRGRRECVPSTPHRASAQHDRPLAREEHTPVAVPFHGVRQSLAFGVAAGGDEVLGCEGVVDLDELLGND